MLLDPFIMFGTVEGWNLTTATFDQSMSVTEEGLPYGVWMSEDGTKLFVVGTTGDDINQYTLSTAYDLSSHTHDGVLDVSGQVVDPTGLCFADDGSMLYVISRFSDNIARYSLTTPYVITSGVTHEETVSAPSDDGNPMDLFVSNDGTRLYIAGEVNDRVREYSMTAHDLSTLSDTTRFADVSGKETGVTGVTFKPDGTAFFISGPGSNQVHRYDMSTAWQPDTATFTHSSGAIQTEAQVQGHAWANNGQKLVVIGRDADTVYAYDVAA